MVATIRTTGALIFMKKGLLLLIFFASIQTVQAIQIYQWKDVKGTWQFTEYPPLAGVPYQLKELPDNVTVYKSEEKPADEKSKDIEKIGKPVAIEKVEKSEEIIKPVIIPDARTEKISPISNEKKVPETKQPISEEPVVVIKKPSLIKAQRQSRYVSDYAQLLLLEDRQRLQEILEQFERQTGIETTIFTCYTLADYEGGLTGVDNFSAQLLKEWQLKQGILIVIVLLDKQLHIKTTSQFNKEEQHKIQNIREEILIPTFKQGHFSEGLLKAVQQIIYLLKPPPVLKNKEQTADNRKETYYKREDYWLEMVLILGLSLWWAIIRLWRRRKNRCPQCAGKLQKVKLNQEFIALRCTICGTQLILAPAHSPRYWQRCPSCSNSAFHVKSWCWDNNERLIIARECQVCGFKRQEKVRFLSAQNSVDDAA
jgi:uncharacterized membrane protein YgcG